MYCYTQPRAAGPAALRYALLASLRTSGATARARIAAHPASAASPAQPAQPAQEPKVGGAPHWRSTRVLGPG